MIPIFQHTDQGNNGLSFERFQDEFIGICESHKEDGRALAFAFILSDFTHPQISKVLKDEDYWNALDQISGHLLSVFSFHYRKPRRQRAPRRQVKDEFIHMLTSFDVEMEEQPKQIIAQHFNLKSAVAMPSILFFQVAEGEVSDSFLIELSKPKIEDSFLEIKDILSIAADSVSKVNIEATSDEVMFNLIRSQLRIKKAKTVIKEAVRAFKSLKDVAGLFGGGL